MAGPAALNGCANRIRDEGTAHHLEMGKSKGESQDLDGLFHGKSIYKWRVTFGGTQTIANHSKPPYGTEKGYLSIHWFTIMFNKKCLLQRKRKQKQTEPYVVRHKKCLEGMYARVLRRINVVVWSYILGWGSEHNNVCTYIYIYIYIRTNITQYGQLTHSKSDTLFGRYVA